MTAYYNEIDKPAAAVLRQLISDGVIAPGDVDERSIKEVRPDDLRGYKQCHFFAGGGLWSVAARMAGWRDDRELWTGSCPCQPFSVAGKRSGEDDPRHLWPDFHRLIGARRPAVVVGEQVAGAAGYGWLDGVRADLAREDYASRGVDIPACAVDAPHQRNRLYWLAMANAEGQQRGAGLREDGAKQNGFEFTDSHGAVPMADTEGERSGREFTERGPQERTADGRSYAGGVDLVDAHSERREERSGAVSIRTQQPRVKRPNGRNGSWWADAEWIACHDGKARRAKPGSPLLVDGFSGRVDLWRIAGNAISPVLAAEVLAAIMDGLN